MCHPSHNQEKQQIFKEHVFSAYVEGGGWFYIKHVWLRVIAQQILASACRSCGSRLWIEGLCTLMEHPLPQVIIMGILDGTVNRGSPKGDIEVKDLDCCFHRFS